MMGNGLGEHWISIKRLFPSFNLLGAISCALALLALSSHRPLIAGFRNCDKALERVITSDQHFNQAERSLLARLKQHKGAIAEGVESSIWTEELILLTKFGAIWATTPSRHRHFQRTLSRLGAETPFEGLVSSHGLNLVTHPHYWVHYYAVRRATLQEPALTPPIRRSRDRWALLALLGVGGASYFVARPDHAAATRDWIEGAYHEIREQP